MLADSKGFNLQQQVKVNPESFIQFWCKSSATAENRFQYLQDNLGRELNTLHNITLYIWVDTCNLTKREGDFIYLRSRDNSAVNKFISDLKNIYYFVKQFGNQVKLVFLQLPIYSIHEFIAYQGYQEENSFKEDAVNFYINDTNRLLHVISPKFSEDLQKPRRRKTSTTISYNINYSLLNDGVHPDNILAKLWLIRIINLIHKDCYTL